MSGCFMLNAGVPRELWTEPFIKFTGKIVVILLNVYIRYALYPAG